MKKNKKIIVVGYGSMGRRRVRLMREILPEAEIICVDANPDRLMQVEKDGMRGFASLEEGINEQPDIAFVCTSPGRHAEIILSLIRSGIHVFTELNLTSEKYAEMIAESKAKNVKIFMSSTLLYKRQMEIIDETVKTQVKPLTYIYHVGQYLPDWHPWESYKDFFVGKKETNGVREILAIQLPWVVNTFGHISEIRTTYQQCTNLEINFPDSVIVSIRHENGNVGVFVADVVARKAVTRLEIIGEDLHLFWDGHNDDMYVLNLETKELEQIKVYEKEEHVEGYSDNISEQPYREEILDFLAYVCEGKTPRYSLEQDKQILSVIDQIEEGRL